MDTTISMPPAQIVAERAAAAERDHLRASLSQAFVLHHQAGRLLASGATTECPPAPDDSDVVRRIIVTYRAANETPVGSTKSLWLQGIAELKRPVHDTLLRGDAAEVAHLLRDPRHSMLFYGFDGLVVQEGTDSAGRVHWDSQWTYDNLWRLAEAIGACRLDYPEAPDSRESPEAEALLTGLDAACGFRIAFPNPFLGEVGLATSRGVASYRAVQALYQAWRIADLVGRRPEARILEIGAGLGRTAYYASQFGLRDYTIVDLPMTGVAQAYFLGRCLGGDKIRLHGENCPAEVSILPPATFLDADDRYELVVNVDSMTEMAPDTARRYWQAIADRAPAFLSINHEYNPFTVRDLYRQSPSVRVIRAPYWMRRGYVEELIHFA